MTDPAARGRFVWYDLMSTDPAASIAFYKEVVGWDTTAWSGDGGDRAYMMWTNDDCLIGGVMQLPPEAVEAGSPPHWLAYIYTPDVDATAQQAVELGGVVMMPPQDIPGVGRFAILLDPQGAVFAAFTAAESGSAPGYDGPPKPGVFSWHELTTTDYEAAYAFYTQLFDWEKTDTMDMGEMGAYQMYGRNGMPLGGMFNKTPDMPAEMPPNWLYYADAYAFYTQLFDWEKTDTMDMGEMGAYQMYGRNGMPLGGMFNKTPDTPDQPRCRRTGCTTPWWTTLIAWLRSSRRTAARFSMDRWRSPAAIAWRSAGIHRAPCSPSILAPNRTATPRRVVGGSSAPLCPALVPHGT